MFERSRCLAGLCVLFGFLKICVTQDLNCVITQNGPLTEYRVEDTGNVLDPNPTGCDYSWSNLKAMVVIATHSSNMALVVNHTIDHLITSQCFPQVQLKRDCLSEGKQFRSTCNNTCSSLGRRNGGGPPSPTSGNPTTPLAKSSLDPPLGNSFDWKILVYILVPVVLVVLLVVLVVVLGPFALRWYRNCRPSNVRFSELDTGATLGA